VPATETGAQHGRVHRAGQDRVDADVIGCKFDRHGARQRQQTTFGGSIGGDISRSLDGVDGRDVHDRATTARFHQRVCQLDAQEHRTQVGSHDCIPLFDRGFDQRFGHLHSCIIDQRIQAVGETPACFLANIFQFFAARDVGLDEDAVFEGIYRLVLKS
jgi:hypothetical protein